MPDGSVLDCIFVPHLIHTFNKIPDQVKAKSSIYVAVMLTCKLFVSTGAEGGRIHASRTALLLVPRITNHLGSFKLCFFNIHLGHYLLHFVTLIVSVMAKQIWHEKLSKELIMFDFTFEMIGA